MTSTSKRWFHPNINGAVAERVLLERGIPGSFLCRPSTSKQGDFTLSIRREADVTHIKIQSTEDYYDLYGGEKFASLTELVLFYTERHGQLRQSSGEVIEMRFPLPCADPTSESLYHNRWFHGNTSGKQAEAILLNKGKNGSFLVRESISKPGDYVLTVRVDDRIIHIMILHRHDNNFQLAQNGDQYEVGASQIFENLAELIEHHRNNAMVERTGTVVNLKQPYNATRLYAAAINNRVEELNLNALKRGRNNSGFWEEFESLQQQETKQTSQNSRDEGKKPENKQKNRYRNILPFDHTRVILKDVDESIPGSNYINANYIQPDSEDVGANCNGKVYISTQGCLLETINDFWQMVYQENSKIIVMTSNRVERGRNKCARYWPKLNETNTYGKYEVTNMHKDKAHSYILRQFKLVKTDEKKESEEDERIVYHFHFKAWPDHGVPDDPGEVLDFLVNINTRYTQLKSTNTPVIVHCSAGIGRSGTFIVIDIVLDMVRQQGLDCDIDIYRTIQMIRKQRSGMVQTLAQYQFVYLALKHHVETLTQRMNAQHGKPEYSNILNARKKQAGGGGEEDSDLSMSSSTIATAAAGSTPATPSLLHPTYPGNPSYPGTPAASTHAYPGHVTPGPYPASPLHHPPPSRPVSIGSSGIGSLPPTPSLLVDQQQQNYRIYENTNALYNTTTTTTTSSNNNSSTSSPAPSPLPRSHPQPPPRK